MFHRFSVKERRSAVLDRLTPKAESIRYQEERTRREEEELMRLILYNFKNV